MVFFFAGGGVVQVFLTCERYFCGEGHPRVLSYFVYLQGILAMFGTFEGWKNGHPTVDASLANQDF